MEHDDDDNDHATVLADMDPLTLPEAYDLFGLARSCTLPALKERYRQLVMQSHPDRGGDPLLFQMVQSAFAVISRSRRELRRDVVPDDQWSRMLSELDSRRQLDQERDTAYVVQDDRMRWDSTEFNREFERRHHAPLLFTNDPAEMRQARHALLSGARVSDTQPAFMADFILNKWRDPNELITANLHAQRLDVPTLVHTTIPSIQRIMTASSTSAASVSAVDIVEAWAPPPKEWTTDDMVHIWSQKEEADSELEHRWKHLVETRAKQAEQQEEEEKEEDAAWVKQIMRNMDPDLDLSIVDSLNAELAALSCGQTPSVTFLPRP